MVKRNKKRCRRSRRRRCCLPDVPNINSWKKARRSSRKDWEKLNRYVNLMVFILFWWVSFMMLSVTVNC
jgi:hypothetical protein